MAPPPTTSLSPLSLGPTRLVVADHKLFTTTRHVKITRRKRRWSVSASSNKDSYDGKLVDENMIVLRLRIREIQMEKTKMMNGGGNWRMMEWERRYWQQNYASDVCQAVGMLQNLLMETRPCLAFSILLLVFFSTSLSVLQLVGLGKHIFMSMNF
ncbi:hypothetical protein K1719_029736 [Acacia pycnantha]|nr:hypothetical protein K1719_029736 [Acacia pycnantha]